MQLLITPVLLAILLFSLVIIILMAVFVYAVVIYNTIVKRKNDSDNAFASIDVMLKKRHELIPNLVNAVKGYMVHEKNTLNEIVELRHNAESEGLIPVNKMIIENAISQSLGKIMVKVEDYPDLKASENFLQLQRAINEVEEHISASRRFYNSAVTLYNSSIQVFPNNIIASWFHFSKREVYESKQMERQVVNLNE